MRLRCRRRSCGILPRGLQACCAECCAGHRLGCGFVCGQDRPLRLAPSLAGVGAGREQRPRVVAQLTRTLQDAPRCPRIEPGRRRHRRILSQGEALLLPGEPALPAPQLRAGRRHFEVQPAAVRQADLGPAGQALGIAASEVSRGTAGPPAGPARRMPPTLCPACPKSAPVSCRLSKARGEPRRTRKPRVTGL